MSGIAWGSEKLSTGVRGAGKKTSPRLSVLIDKDRQIICLNLKI